MFSTQKSRITRSPELNFSETRLKDELIQFYRLYDDLISKKMAELKHSNKNLIVIVGEDHFKRKSLLVELVLIKLAEKYGIKNLVTEVSKELLAKVRLTTPDIHHINVIWLMPVVDQQGMETIPADPDHMQSDHIREANMKFALSKLNENAIFITGVNHLLAFVTDPELNSKFDFLPINAMNLTELELRYFKSLSKKHESLLTFASNPQHVIQANIETDINNVPPSKLVEISSQVLNHISTPLIIATSNNEKALRSNQLSSLRLGFFNTLRINQQTGQKTYCGLINGISATRMTYFL